MKISIPQHWYGKAIRVWKIKISELQLKGLQNEFLEYLASFEELIGYEK